MKNDLLKKFLPHLIAIAIFLIAAIIYCSPALQGKVVAQNDITHWKGAVQQSFDYEKTHGHGPLWTNSLFSGMPAFQIGAVPYNNVVPGYVNTIMTLNLPKPISFFFLACICFYILTQVLRIKPWVGIMGALAFAYATYNPIIIHAGHDTKMLSIAYMPAVLASVLLIYDKKYLIGAALTALFSATMIAMNHLQIVYYLVFAIAIMTIVFAIRWIQQKDFKHLLLAASFAIVAGAIGVLTNSVGLLSTYEYQKYTIRGGASYLTDTTTKKSTTSKNGLDEDYAFAYSLKMAEPLVMVTPRMFGGSSGFSEIDQDKSKAIEALRTMPQELQNQLPVTSYWGGITSIDGSVGTDGPAYMGAIVCFLAILGFFITDKKYKWGILAAIIISIMLSWGSFFKGFNDIVFDLVPFYNKFRAPSMILVIPQLLLPLLAVLGINTLVNTENKKSLWPQLKKGLIATGILFVVLLLLYVSLDYMNSMDNEVMKQVRSSGQQQLVDTIKSFYDGLKADRKGLFMGDIMRSFGFIALAALIIWLMIRNTIKPLVATILLTVFIFVDLITIDSKYLNKEKYQEKSDNELVFQKTAYDDSIKADKSHFRVMNFAQDRFQESITSYTHNSIGGYHAAKLRIYQDIIERQLGTGNTAILNMLNAKYFIQKENNPQSLQYGQTVAMQRNPNVLGPCWLVKTIQFVKNADEEMNAISKFNPADTAFVQESFKSSIPNMPVADSTASITLLKNDNDEITYSFNAASNQFAVFSEVYYPGGWKAYIDNKEAPIVKTDYVLRGLAVPAGKHDIRFEFKPDSYTKGKKYTTIFQSLLIILLLAGIFMEWRNRKAKA
ncbi:MAG: hypothetical protein E6H07_13560 [Bacteroidetes bacterium]|nr:MAG: hypothetical protein E6H07_13560 [Bacteroidota bacterium]